MEGKTEDEYYLTIRLLLDNNENKQQDVCVVEESAYKLSDCSFTHNNNSAGGTTSFSFFKAAFNGLNALSGIGILPTPYALSSGGWLSLVLLFIIAIVTLYTALLIQRCMDADSSIRSYPGIGERAFGRKGRILVSTFMNLELYLVATGFLILEGDNLSNILPQMGFEVGGVKIGGKKGFVMIVALIILPTIWLTNMSILSYISVTGIVATAVILVSSFWTGAFGGIGFHERGDVINFKGIPE